jgi:hypothetical protein
MTDAPNPTVQVAFDAADPHRVAHFWAAALGYEKEDNSAFVKQLLDAGRLLEADTIETENGREFADVAACRDPDGRRPRLFFQRVPEAKTVKNRLHLDLNVGAEAAPAEIERLKGLGATFAWTSDDRGGLCTTLRDPEGNEFDVY